MCAAPGRGAWGVSGAGWIHLPGGGYAIGGSSGSTLHQVFWVGDL